MAHEVQSIEFMERGQLKALWSDMFGAAPPRSISMPFLRRILAFEIQARRHGGLPAALRKKLRRAEAGEARPGSPKMRPGGRLIREWNGVSHVVNITERGFEWRGQRYRSLSAVAREITGAHWSGPRFFALNDGAAS